MDIFERYATDPSKALEGVWHQLGKETSILVARWGTPEAVRFHRDLLNQHREALNSADPDAAARENTRILVETMANKILLGWKGIEFKKKPMEYSVDNARTLLKLDDFRDVVWALANNIENYRYDAEVELEKN